PAHNSAPLSPTASPTRSSPPRSNNRPMVTAIITLVALVVIVGAIAWILFGGHDAGLRPVKGYPSLANLSVSDWENLSEEDGTARLQLAMVRYGCTDTGVIVAATLNQLFELYYFDGGTASPENEFVKQINDGFCTKGDITP
ncbi:MAG: hypothetical protein LC793_15115, partial [Thermomicrobia bacterium]|nr:hypothetical protein [Thermomicrobia bacterium]